ncbi:hypothetical protein [Aeromonas caviae]|uniref:Uncharacterized protein n=1 Tax=Aeromonas caviae TaxID=648 RepID=A0AA42UG74_AERCA|nr:hypothetical protein [Aeromonas caviae]MDH1507913.1 hypothetical protein [Aeromonas caviae]MDH1848900.1 hypothetical protein [Aeromonas caviae]
MIDFHEAIKIAMNNVTTLIPKATDINLEGAMISADDRLYEINLSYEIPDNSFESISDEINNNPLYAMTRLMRKRREQKVFLVNKLDGKFRGFKNFKERS